MEIIPLSAALAAAFVWAVASIVSHAPVRYFGVFRFLEIQLPAITIFLALIVAFYGGWRSINFNQDWLVYIVSALVGILLGDLAFMKCLALGGPRRCQLLFTLNAPVAATLGYFYFGETLSIKDLFGACLMLSGLFIAVLLNKSDEDDSKLEQLDGKLGLVVFWGGLAAICQASGLIMMKPVLVDGADPIAVSTIRAGICAITILVVGRILNRKSSVPFKLDMFVKACIGGILGYACAMGLLLVALRSANVGLVSTLAAMTPVIMLPLLWVLTKKPPKPACWLGAFIVVAGVGLLSY